MFLKSPRLCIHELWNYYFLFKICNIKKKEISYSIQNHLIYGPNLPSFHFTLREVFIDKLYSRLNGCKNILDLGGFLGESALYFSSFCEQVYVYEVDPDNFTFVIKNTEKNKKIKKFNIGVVANKGKKLFYNKGIANDPGGYISEIAGNNARRIETISFSEVISQESFDGLKMDIEGSEYEIVDEIISQDITSFQRGYIEFHRYKNNIQKIDIIKRFVFWAEKYYTVSFEDVYGKNINFNDALNHSIDVFVLYFEK